MATTLVRIQLLSKTSTDFSTTNPVLLDGEMGIANSGSAVPVMKVGDGVRPWSALPDIVAAGAGADYVAGPVNTLPAGSPATVVIDNTISPPTISFGIPAGAQGDTGGAGPVGPVGPIGPAGPANALTIGTVTTSAPGGAADASITGTPPAQVLNLVIPQGIQGPVGGVGPAGPANALTIGTVTTGAPGSAADAVISGTPPAQVLSLTIPQGPQGIQGIQGIQGNPGTPGAGAPANPTALIGLAAVNGVAVTFIRSDGAPALSQAIAPTWTAQHIFAGPGGGALTSSIIVNGVGGGSIMFAHPTAPANKRQWDIVAGGDGRFYFRTLTDAGAGGVAWMLVTRTDATVVDSVSFPSSDVLLGKSLRALGAIRCVGNFSTPGADVNQMGVELSGGGASAFVLAYNRTTTTYGELYLGGASIMLDAINSGVNIKNGLLHMRGKIVMQDLVDGYLRLNASSEYTNGIYTPLQFRATGWIQSDAGFGNDGNTKKLIWNHGLTYGTVAVQNPGAPYHGVILVDGVRNPVFMTASGGNLFGVYAQSASTPWWSWNDDGVTFTIGKPTVAPSFNATSSRKIKRETGKPSRAADILARLRPIMYRLLEKGSPEQLGMIAEEVADVCPQLSNGKTISYDRLAILLLTDWQESRGLALN